MPRTRTSALSILAIAIFASVATADADAISTDEKRPLEAAKKEASRLVHPTLGFSIASPGDGFVFKPAPSVATHVPPGIDAYGYAWVGDGGKRALLIVDVADTAPDKGAYEAMVAGLRSNMFRALVDDRALHVDHEQIAWSKTAPESHSTTSSGPLRFRFDTYAGSFAGKRRTIAVMALTLDDSLAGVVASFHR